MKFLLAGIILLSTLVLLGCDEGKLFPEPSNIIISIQRETLAQVDAVVCLSADSAKVDYVNRTLTISGNICLGGASGTRWVANLKSQEPVVIYLPGDSQYTIYVGKQKHVFSIIKTML